MTKRFLNQLLDEASRPFRPGGHFAYHYARGKLSSDSIFREILKRGLFTAPGRYLDLGCGQGSLFAWLLAARQLYEAGHWPKDWPAAPKPLLLHGIELMQKDVDRAARAFGAHHPIVRIEQGDMTTADFGHADVITILDALHYFDHARQTDVIRRIRAALPPGGLFLTRVGDASAGRDCHRQAIDRRKAHPRRLGLRIGDAARQPLHQRDAEPADLGIGKPGERRWRWLQRRVERTAIIIEHQHHRIALDPRLARDRLRRSGSEAMANDIGDDFLEHHIDAVEYCVR